MAAFITAQNTLFAIGIIGTIFTIYNYFRNPQIKADKTDALLIERMKYMQEESDRRFNDIQENFKGLLLQSNNHIHTVDTKVEALTVSIVEMGKDITKLSTILEERIPKSK